MKKLATLVGIVVLAACGGRDVDDATDTAAGNVAPPPATVDTGPPIDTTKMSDTTARDTTP